MADKKTKATKKSETKTESKDSKLKDDAKSKTKESSTGEPAGYSLGERQKPVSKAYRRNWDSIFSKK